MAFTVAAFSPGSGPVGTAVTILGSGFSSTLSQDVVQFNGITATVTAASNTLLTAIVPASAATGAITVSVSGGTPATSSSSFTIVATPGVPTISSFAPTIAVSGVPITIAGSNFIANPASDTVKIAGTPLSVQSATTTAISTSTPNGSGSGHISVQTPYGQAVSSGDFFFVPFPYTESSVSLATRLDSGSTATTTFSVTKQIAIMIFDATQGQKARLLVNTSSGGQFATVYNPDGTVLLSSTGLPSSGATVLDTPTFGSTGTYTIIIKSDPQWQGAMALTLTTPSSAADFSLSAVPDFYQDFASGPAFKIFVNAGAGLSTNVQLSASGLPVCATANFNPTQPSGSAASQLSFTLNGCAAGSYGFTVTGTSGTLTHSLNLTLNVNPLPSGWTEADITAQGYADYANGTFTINSVSTGILFSTDVFSFVNQALNGDGSIVARVTNLYNTPSSQAGPVAYGGVMIRETLTAGSSTMALRLNSTAGAELQWRSSTNGTLNTFTGPAIAAPYWLKISRAGTSISAFVSSDGSSWTQVGSSQTISMATSVYIGITGGSANFGRVAQAVFDNVTLTVSPDFGITATPTGQGIAPGGTANYTISTNSLAGFTDTVALTVSGLPSGATATFTPSAISGAGSSTLAIATTTGTPVGSYTVTVTGTDGSLSHSVPIVLAVGAPDFAISVSPASASGLTNTNVTYSVVISPLNGFTGSVVLDAAGIPLGSSIVFSPTTIVGSGTSTATITIGANTPARTYQVLFVGKNGSTIHSVTANLTVTATDFSLSLSAGWLAFPAAGGSLTRNVTVTPANNFAKTVTLSLTNLPAGASAAFNPTSISTGGTSVLTITMPANLVPGTFVANVVGTVIDPSQGNPSHFIPMNLIVQPSGSLPTGWTNVDIGSAGIPGDAAYSGGTFTIQGSNVANFTYVTLSGDSMITARVATLNNIQFYATAGVMMTETLTGDSKLAYLPIQYTNPYSIPFFTRSTTGGATSIAGGPVANPPYWLRIVRQANNFSGYVSADGITWTQVGTTTSIAMTNTVYVGISVTSTYASEITTATLDNVSAVNVAAIPTFNPAAGTYTSTQSVVLSTLTSGASIRYTTDGTTPSDTVGTLYAGAISVPTTTTIKAIAYRSGMLNSSVVSATYTIQVLPPTFSPPEGTYGSAQTVTLTTGTSGASIRYTTDGTTPTSTSGTVYTGPIVVNSTTTVIAIAYANGMLDSALSSATFTLNFGGSAWYNTSWTNRKSVTVDHTKVSGSSALTSYPMLFSVTDANLKTTVNGGNVGKSDGTDILFTASDGTTKLDHELEYYNATTGQVIAWVRIPSLSPTADTTLFVYYGNASASDQQNKTGVWDSNFKGVYHLGNGTTLSASDSTNTNNPTSTTATVTSGTIDGAANFSGTQRITLPNIALTTGVTLEAWIKPTNFEQFDHVLCKGFSSNVAPWVSYCLGMDNTASPNRKIGMSVTIGGTNSGVNAATPVHANTWYHVVGTYDGNYVRMFINGTSDATPLALTGTLDTISQNTEIGYNTLNGNQQSFIGVIDEVRISSVARSADWVLTEYRNESTPGTFVSLGSSENPTTVAAPVFSPVPAIYASGQSVALSSTTFGASIRYTTDGSTPTSTSGTLYTGPISVASTATIKAIAYASGLSDSSVVSATYTIDTTVSWYNTSWTNRKSVTVDHTKVSGSSALTSYPMLFSVTDANLKTTVNGGNVGKSDGTDILFTASDGTTKLDHELEYYNATTGQVIAWVRIPSLSPTADTTLFVYYGNASASDQQNKTGVWDSNFKGVYHLGNGTTLSASDSTNTNNPTSTTATVTSGTIDGAANFSGTQRITLPNIALTTGVTLEAWIKPTALNTADRIVCKAYSSNTSPWTNYCLSLDSTPAPNRKAAIGFTMGGTNYLVYSTTAINTNTWYHLVGTYDGSNVRLYVNGASDASPLAHTGSVDTVSQVTEIGFNTVFTSSQNFTGVLDEVRISNSARSGDWIATEYRNQNAPATFFSVGSQYFH